MFLHLPLPCYCRPDPVHAATFNIFICIGFCTRHINQKLKKTRLDRTFRDIYIYRFFNGYGTTFSNGQDVDF